MATSTCRVPAVLAEWRPLRSLRHLVLATILASLMASDGVAVAVGVHLMTSDHHALAHSHGDESHQHEAMVPSGHDHDAVRAPRNVSPRTIVAAVVPQPVHRSFSAEGVRLRPAEIISTSAPPSSLFLANCSLLI